MLANAVSRRTCGRYTVVPEFGGELASPTAAAVLAFSVRNAVLPSAQDWIIILPVIPIRCQLNDGLLKSYATSCAWTPEARAARGWLEGVRRHKS